MRYPKLRFGATLTLYVATLLLLWDVAIAVTVLSKATIFFLLSVTTGLYAYIFLSGGRQFPHVDAAVIAIGGVNILLALYARMPAVTWDIERPRRPHITAENAGASIDRAEGLLLDAALSDERHREQPRDAADDPRVKVHRLGPRDDPVYAVIGGFGESCDAACLRSQRRCREVSLKAVPVSDVSKARISSPPHFILLMRYLSSFRTLFMSSTTAQSCREYWAAQVAPRGQSRTLH
mmetsp:Transcript_1654/g.4984  ORF Transcript_1654/g.4984 Transcript_1654/m.4984 type:complete len:236 (-) Transcript_1654:207-914(-)